MKKWIKHRFNSKTYRFAAFMAAMVALEAKMSLLQPFLPGNVYAYFVVVLNVGIVYFREITTKPLRDK